MLLKKIMCYAIIIFVVSGAFGQNLGTCACVIRIYINAWDT